MSSQAERRAITQRPTITKRDDGSQIMEGYGAVFYDAADPGTEYWLYEDLCERIDAACFDRALKEGHPCRCLVNHDPNFRLGRADKGTLRLKCDKRGLAYDCDIPDTQVGRDTAADLANGNLDGSSFSFRVTGQKWEDKKMPNGDYLTIRTITDVDLFDVGPVAFPAYEATTAGMRSTERRESVKAQRDEWRAGNHSIEAEAIAIRLREIKISE